MNLFLLLKCLLLWWRHRRDVELYDNVWRRPDGVCVNDAGQVLGPYFSMPAEALSRWGEA